MEEVCPICLELITATSIIGTIFSCNHFYHEHCISTWCKNSNSCPTCRKLYYQIKFSFKTTPSNIIRTQIVQDRLPENPAIDYIPSEFVQRATNDISTLAPSSTRSQFTPNVCSICSSSQHRPSLRMTVCNGCGSGFHLNCLRPIDQVWNCPICDLSQDCELPVSIRVSRILNHSVVDEVGRSIERPWRTRNNTAAMENPLETDFDDGYVYSQRHVINGGVIRRREERQRQNLTEEEEKSWKMFENARLGEDTTNEDIVPVKSERKKRKKNLNDSQNVETHKQIQVKTEPLANELVAPFNATNSKGSSRISSLIQQIRSKKLSNDSYRLQNENVYTTNFGNNSACSSSSLSPVSLSPNGSEGSGGEEDVPKVEKFSLSLKQKKDIQTHIRTHLRPIYKPGTKDSGNITSEEEFIRINKDISRKIYRHILSLQSPQEVFNEDGHLKRIVDEMVQENIGRL